MFMGGNQGIPSFGDLSWKQPCRLGTVVALPANTRVGNVLTANANGALGMIDGQAPAVGDRILVILEATNANNGIYSVTSLGDATHPWVMTRATDTNTIGKAPRGTAVEVLAGTLLNGTLWVAFGAWVLNSTGPDWATNALAVTGGPDGRARLTALRTGGSATLSLVPDGSGVWLIEAKGNADTFDELTVTNNGGKVAVQLGAVGGAAAPDVGLSRPAAKTLQIDDTTGAALTLVDLKGAPVNGKAPVVNVYAAGTTWVRTANFQYLDIELVGGGGQGGGAPAVNTAGDGRVAAGGGAGGYARKIVKPGDFTGDLTIVVGAGGSTGGAGAAGQSGGQSNVQATGLTTIIANGGAGANASAAERVIPTSDGGYGVGGTASGGDENIPGNSGGVGLITSSMQDGGKGGASLLGPGGDGFHTTTTTATSGAGHAPAGGWGGGGGGASGAGTSNVARAGGAGAAGVVIVREFYGP